MHQSVKWCKMRPFLMGQPDGSLCYKGRRYHVFTIVESFRRGRSSDRASNPFDLVIMFEGGTEDYTLLSCDSCFNRNDLIGYLGDADLFTYIPNYLVLSTRSVLSY